MSLVSDLFFRSTTFHEYSSSEQLASELAIIVTQQILTAINVQGICHMVLPGGQSPRRFLEYLGNYDLPWKNIHLYPSDERCVPLGDRERNDRMLEEVLLSRVNMPAGNFHRIPAELGPEEGAIVYAIAINNAPVFDVAILGMGVDGHVASLFPGHVALYDCRDAVPVIAAPKPPQSRVTIGLMRLRSAANRHVIALGLEKRALFSKNDSLNSFPAFQLAGDIWYA